MAWCAVSFSPPTERNEVLQHYLLMDTNGLVARISATEHDSVGVNCEKWRQCAKMAPDREWLLRNQ